MSLSYYELFRCLALSTQATEIHVQNFTIYCDEIIYIEYTPHHHHYPLSTHFKPHLPLFVICPSPPFLFQNARYAFIWFVQLPINYSIHIHRSSARFQNTHILVVCVQHKCNACLL